MTATTLKHAVTEQVMTIERDVEGFLAEVSAEERHLWTVIEDAGNGVLADLGVGGQSRNDEPVTPETTTAPADPLQNQQAATAPEVAETAAQDTGSAIPGAVDAAAQFAADPRLQTPSGDQAPTEIPGANTFGGV